MDRNQYEIGSAEESGGEEGFYYLDKFGEQRGPVSKPRLKELFEEKEIRIVTYIWTEGFKDWKKITDVFQVWVHLQPDARERTESLRRIEWYYQSVDTEHGPFTLDELRDLLSEGTIDESTLLRHHSECPEWTALSDIHWLFDLIFDAETVDLSSLDIDSEKHLNDGHRRGLNKRKRQLEARNSDQSMSDVSSTMSVCSTKSVKPLRHSESERAMLRMEEADRNYQIRTREYGMKNQLRKQENDPHTQRMVIDTFVLRQMDHGQSIEQGKGKMAEYLQKEGKIERKINPIALEAAYKGRVLMEHRSGEDQRTKTGKLVSQTQRWLDQKPWAERIADVQSKLDRLYQYKHELVLLAAEHILRDH